MCESSLSCAGAAAQAVEANIVDTNAVGGFA
jgi:hypothetical protein